MMKKLSFLMGVFFMTAVMSDSALARECQPDDLILEFVHEHTMVPQNPEYTVVVQGVLQMPTPGYKYDLKMGNLNTSRIARGVLKFYRENPNAPSLTVITELKVSETIKVPKDLEGLQFDVVKTFDWGPEHFSVKFPDNFNAGAVSFLCMSPDVYK